MTPDTPLYRMVSPSFMKDGNPTSQVFKPTRKDNGRLSVYNGDQISPQATYEHYTGSPHWPRPKRRRSIGDNGSRM